MWFRPRFQIVKGARAAGRGPLFHGGRRRAPRVPLAALALILGLAPAAGAETVCTLIRDVATGATLLEQGDCRTRVTPASTFKIPLAVIGYEAGLLIDAHAPVMAFREGDPDWGGEAWRRDTDPAAWLRHSVVWYSQRLTRALGAETLTRQARAFGYGNADFSGDPGFGNGLERAWIASSLKISPQEQAAFLRALARDALPVRREAMARAREIVETRSVGAWTLHGKTGAAYPRRADRSFDYARGWGWYAGWARREGPEARGDGALIFVRLTQARERRAGSPGVRTRDAFLAEWPKLVGD